MKVLLPSLFCFSHIVVPLFCLTHSSRLKNGDTPGGARNMLHLGAVIVPSRIGGERITRTYLTVTRWFVTSLRGYFQANSPFDKHYVAAFVFEFPVKLGLPMETFLDPCW